jgi:glycine cleavage system H protein
MHPKELRYSPDHIWAKDEGNGQYRLGITFHYQDKIKSVVFLDLSRAGARIKRGEPFGAIESSKISTDLISPVTGSVAVVNQAVTDKPGLVNKDPYGEGWLVVVHPDTPGEINDMLSSSEYLTRASEESGS